MGEISFLIPTKLSLVLVGWLRTDKPAWRTGLEVICVSEICQLGSFGSSRHF